MKDKVLFAFGLFITGLGWGTAGFLLQDIWLGIGMAVAAVAVVGLSILRIEEII